MRVGLITDDGFVSHSNLEIVDWLSHQQGVDLACLISQKAKSDTSQIGAILSKLKRVGFGGVYFKLNEYIERLTLNQEELDIISRNYKARRYFQQEILVEPIISKSGFVYRYKSSDLEAVKSQRLDLIIRAGSGILRGDILKSSRLGIISFHHANNLINRGGPPGFWEIIHKSPGSGFTIQILKDELDGGEVLYRGEFLTKFTWLKNYANMQKKANFYMKKILGNVITSGQLPPALPASPYSMPLYRKPTIWITLRYQMQCLFIVTNIILRKISRKSFRWSIGYQHKGWENLTMWNSAFIKNPRNKFLADPFCVREDGRNYIFAEEYCYKQRKAHISVLLVEKDQVEHLGIAINEDFHLSYPYLFEYNGTYYMIPESCASREIRLYKCTSFPMVWKFEKILMSNLSAADTTVFFFGGKWWMFTNIDPVMSGDHCSELFAFWSDSPISDKWIPHAQNPLIVDPVNARMGGLVCRGGKVFRVAQSQGFRLYGKEARLKEIVKLTENDFEEIDSHTIKPEFLKGIVGTHHLHSNGNFSVFDYVKIEKIPT